MTESYFVEVTNEIIERIQEIFGAREKPLILMKSQAQAEKYRRVIRFSGTCYDLTYKNTCQEEMLLSGFIDAFADYIEVNRAFMEMPDGNFPWDGPFAPPQKESTRRVSVVAETLYNCVDVSVFRRFRIGLGVDLSLMDELSTRTYEGDSGGGHIVFCASQKGFQPDLVPEFPRNIFWDWEFLSQIRKLMAGMHEENALLFVRQPDGQYQFEGYCADFNPSWKRDSEICCICCQGAGAWTLFYNGTNGVLQRSHSRLQICGDPQSYAMKKLESSFPASFRNSECRMNAGALLRMAKKQKHGTSLIFMDFANEAVRQRVETLCTLQRAVKVRDSAFCAERSETLNISRMDGALLVNAHTMCIEYIAAILDGRALLPGQLDKGSRHNSIRTFLGDLCYVAKEPPTLCAVIFSSDGDVEVVTGNDITRMLPHAEEGS